MEVIYEALADSSDYIYFKLSGTYRECDLSTAISKREDSALSVPPHFHKSAEIKLVLNGDIIVGVDGTEEKISAGELCFIDSYKVHYYICGNAECYDLVFDSELINYLMGESKSFKCVIKNKNTFDALVKLFEENYSGFDNYDKQQRMGFLAKAVGILMLNEEAFPKANDSACTLSRNMIIYIYNHYKDPIDIRKLAKTFGYSEGYISVMFKKATGSNFRDFLNKYRISVADSIKEANSKKSLREISEDVGYSSWVTFFRAYKKYSKTKI